MSTRGMRRLVEKLGGNIRGASPTGSPTGVASLDESSPDRIALYVDGRYRHLLGTVRALAVLTDETHAPAVLEAGLSAWVHPDPMAALAALLDLLHPEPAVTPPPWDPDRGCWLGSSASVADDAVLGPGCVIHEDVTLEAGCRVAEHAVIEAGVTVGQDGRLGAGCHVGRGSVLGARVEIGPGAVLGSEGFGLRPAGARMVPVRHVGTVRIGDDVSVGARCVVARATLGTTSIGDGTRIDAHVQVGHNVHIGRDCVIAAQAGLAGSVEIGDGVLIGGQAGLADHVKVGDGARIAARSGVIGDVPAGETWEGYPAMPRWQWLRLVATLRRDGE